jgi:hypothetical protein
MLDVLYALLCPRLLAVHFLGVGWGLVSEREEKAASQRKDKEEIFEVRFLFISLRDTSITPMYMLNALLFC